MSAPKLDGLLEVGRHEGVVDHDFAAALVGDGADGGDVGEAHQRIGRRLDVDVARVAADGALDVARIGRVDIGELQTEVGHDLVEEPRYAAVEIVGGDDVIASFHQMAERADGGHSAGENRCGDTAFQRSQVLLPAECASDCRRESNRSPWSCQALPARRSRWQRWEEQPLQWKDRVHCRHERREWKNREHSSYA